MQPLVSVIVTTRNEAVERLMRDRALHTKVEDQQQVRCALCNFSDLEPYFRAKEWSRSPHPIHTIVRCRQCKLVQSTLRPAAEEITQHYNRNYYEVQLGSTAALAPTTDLATLFTPILSNLRRLAGPKARRLLDVGCGTGAFGHMARRSGWDVWGTEVSPYAAAAAQARYDLPVSVGTLADLPLAVGPFDVITLWEVIEHCAAPLEVLAQAHARLVPKGLLALSTPNVKGLSARLLGARSVTFCPPEHLYYFSSTTLAMALRAARFRPLTVSSHLVLLSNLCLSVSSGVARLRRRFGRPVHDRQTATPSTLYRAIFNFIYHPAAAPWILCPINRVLSVTGLGDGLVAYARPIS